MKYKYFKILFNVKMKCVFPTDAFCRLCLNVDVKVHKINTAHATLIENIFKLKDFYIPCEVQYVCSICFALLSKTSNFAKMILNAQKLLDDLLKTTDVITTPMLKSIDRHINGLNPLSVRSFGIFDDDKKNYDYHNNINLKINHNKRVEMKKDDIKKTENNSENEKNCIEISSSNDEDIQEPLINVSLENELKEIKNDPLDIYNKTSKCNETSYSLTPDDNQGKQNIKKDKIIKKTPDCQKSVPQRKYRYTDSDSFSETDSSSKRKRDEDYQPDSTSHSEDSVYDSYDDTGKRIKKPKDVDRVYPRKCDHCDYQIPKRGQHYHHYLFEHPNIEYPYGNKIKYPCSFCGVLKRVHTLKDHELTHKGAQIKCPLCPKVFLCKKFVNQHKLSVHGKRIYTCDYCSKSCKTRRDISLHIRIHTGEKPFKCHICGAGFAHSGNRTIHIRSAHQNIKYVPKKRKQNETVRRNKKDDLTDADTESSGEEIVQKKRKRSLKSSKSKKKLQLKTDTKPASKEQPEERKKLTTNKLQNKNDSRMESGDGKENNKRKIKKVRHCLRNNNSTDTFMNSEDKRRNGDQPVRNCKSDNFIEADQESDDECLAETKKKKHDLEMTKDTLNEEESGKTEPPKKRKKK